MIYLFEHMSGLNINFQKTLVIIIGGSDSHAREFASMFNYKVGYFPITYLGLPLRHGRLIKADWLRVIEKIEKKIIHLERLQLI